MAPVFPRPQPLVGIMLPGSRCGGARRVPHLTLDLGQRSLDEAVRDDHLIVAGLIRERTRVTIAKARITQPMTSADVVVSVRVQLQSA